MNASSHDTSMQRFSSTCTLFSGSSVFVWRCLRVSYGRHLWLWRMEPHWRECFVFFSFCSLAKSLRHNASPALFLIPIPSSHSHHRLAHLTGGSVLDASSMQSLTGTVTLCLCIAAVTLSHDWRPARLLVANLRHTHSGQCFLNRIVTVLVQSPSKQCSFPNCWLLLEKTQVGPSFYQKGRNILVREALISLCLYPHNAMPYDTMKDSDPLSKAHEIWIVSQSGSPM